MAAIMTWAKIAVQIGAERGMAKKLLIKTIREKVAPIPWKEARRLYDAHKKVPEKLNKLKYLRKDKRVPTDHTVRPYYTKMKRQYSYITEADVIDPETGDAYKIYGKVNTDKRLTRERAESEGMKQINSQATSGNLSIVNYRLSRVENKSLI